MLKGLVTAVHVLIALSLIAVVLLQSGKSAGLSGSIAGGAEAIFGGKKKGLDEKLGRLTAFIAIAFGITSMVLVVWK
ncbi:preprotein translocase, SecG subunit [Desulfotomaculum nigrificans CO-1-SRB]|uniref:Protein-export membrane protein SecG n=1 Tax=Desulfotomaculum nigrificans (strain DSM 14880 / VKM B-2319 / CO-1-SRB) TaxID=868595 RepID=F6B4W1_DESCC|nr:preprotein translocase subunit SecG [Desulfotomaculum nigrificans]AEF95333.1 preprotein translocase, SecG subunit [Desulfotomaculum nigrificans CO-1-SRB]